MVFYKRPYLMVVLIGPFIIISFGTTYLISVHLGYITPVIPYISDTGTIPPASCIFGQCLDIGALMTFYITYTRYLHLKLLSYDSRLLTWLNRISLGLGIFSCLGSTIVGNFQETNVYPVHMLGAFMAFILIYLYCIIQTYVSYRLSDILYSPLPMLLFRLFFLGIATTNIIMGITFQQLARAKWDGDDFLHWKPTDGGYTEHIITTCSEWILCFSTFAVLTTLFPDFRQIEVVKPDVRNRLSLANSELFDYAATTKSDNNQKKNNPAAATITITADDHAEKSRNNNELYLTRITKITKF